VVPRTIWPHAQAGHNQDGVRDLQRLFGASPFASPKPVRLMRRVLAVAPGDVVADFFAGSGTFAHAVLAEARERDTPRRFVLAEAGEHFETVLRPRVIKTIHAVEWDAGAPRTRDGVSALVQCLRIESYEDALDAVELERTDAQADLLSTSAEFRVDYVLRYMLTHESRSALLNRGAFGSPFDVTATATIDGERQKVAVDLVETFNWLLGLRVDGRATRAGVTLVRGVGSDGRRVLVLWRNVADTPNEELDDWFAALDEAVRGPLPDVIYVNGDSTLEMLRPEKERWNVELLEAEFERLMFLVADEHHVA